MLLNHDELMLLSRGGRVPRAERPRPGPTDALQPRHRLIERLHGRRRLPSWGRGCTPRPRRGELGAHAYLELEFVVDDEG